MKENTVILQGKEVAVGYRKGKTVQWIAEKISFSLKAGQLTCLLGPNGVGKSTLIKAILGQNLPVKGEMLYRGEAIQNLDARTMARKVSVVLTDRISPGNLTVRQLVGLGRIPFTNWLGTFAEEDKRVIELAIESTKIGYLADKKVAEISDGQLQKTMIARALAQDGELMILDEPTAHLDLVNRMEIMQLLREIAHTRRKAILVVTHDLDIAVETADEFWLMPCGGALVSGAPEDLILSGQINQLLPSEHLHFNPLTGKVQSSIPVAYPQIRGGEEVSQWLKLALRKNQIEMSDRTQIFVQKDPLCIIIENNGVQKKMSSIQEVINELHSLGETHCN
jgi:iron complex transport system ATP-binding protein